MNVQNGVISNYLHQGLDCVELQKRINATVVFLQRRSQKFDAIAFRGMSGALVAPAVAARLKKNLLMVRKATDSNHSSLSVEGFNGAPQRYVIIDDFIFTGATVREIQRTIGQMKHGAGHKLIGMVCYAWPNCYNVESKSRECGITVPVWKTGIR